MEIKKWNEISGFLEDADAHVLLELAKGKECFEIGSLRGKSTVLLASVADRVTAIDTFKATGDGAGQTEDPKIFEKNLNDFKSAIQGYNNIEYFVNRSEKIVPNFSNESYDLAFIDGSHNYDDVKADIIMSWPKIRIGGVMALHDYGKKGWGGPTEAVNEFFAPENINGPYHCLVYIVKGEHNENLCV